MIAASINRRKASISDPEFDKAFSEYKKRDYRRKSMILRREQIRVDINRAKENIFIILCVIMAIMIVVMLACMYIRKWAE